MEEKKIQHYDCFFDREPSKSNLKPFDLEAAKSGKPICTRDGRNDEMKTLLITETEARMIYSSISGEFKKKLEDTFGIERLTLSFQELVKTYENACEITGSVPDIECDDRSELARLKLIQIYKASNILNNNWKITPLGTQCAFYPSFTWEKDRLVCGDICHTLYSVSYDPKLCCGKREDAFYIGTRFIDLYRDYLLLE